MQPLLLQKPKVTQKSPFCICLLSRSLTTFRDPLSLHAAPHFLPLGLLLPSPSPSPSQVGLLIKTSNLTILYLKFGKLSAKEEMEACCDLQVDVNGEETFLVDKKIISLHSGRLRKLFGKLACSARHLKVIFQDFPGGSEGFELISRFCYSRGQMEITPHNISLLHSAAHFMDMTSSVSGTEMNLMEQTQKLLDEIRYWTWPELLVALKQCQELHPESSVSTVLGKCLDSLIRRLVIASETSPSPSSVSSSDSSACRLSCDTKSTESLKNALISRSTWWFEDLLCLRPSLLEMMVKSMVSHRLDHLIISKFLFYYQKSKFTVVSSSQEKGKILEAVIDSLCMLKQSSVPCKSLFGILRVALRLNMSRSRMNKLENMIGSRLDQATLDNLLIPSPYGTNYLYDVNLVLRFIKAFLQGRTCRIPTQLNKVGSLLDLYMVEVAPDPSLKPSKFNALVSALPDNARDSYDEIYHAMDMYFEVHSGLSEEEKMKLCCSLKYEKLSPESHKRLSQNTKFPSKTAIQALTAKQCKLKSLLQATNDPKLPTTRLPCGLSKGKVKDEESNQIMIHAGELDTVADNERLKAQLKGMQCRVMELEKVCQKMQTQMTKILKSKAPSHCSARSLPKLCS